MAKFFNQKKGFTIIRQMQNAGREQENSWTTILSQLHVNLPVFSFIQSMKYETLVWRVSCSQVGLPTATKPAKKYRPLLSAQTRGPPESPLQWALVGSMVQSKGILETPRLLQNCSLTGRSTSWRMSGLVCSA